jgi:hypothetical protein
MSLPYPPCGDCGCPGNYHEIDFNAGTKRCLVCNRYCERTEVA